jgi:hypothetical protein
MKYIRHNIASTQWVALGFLKIMGSVGSKVGESVPAVGARRSMRVGESCYIHPVFELMKNRSVSDGHQ